MQDPRLCQDTWHRDMSTNNLIHLGVNVEQRKPRSAIGGGHKLRKLGEGTAEGAW